MRVRVGCLALAIGGAGLAACDAPRPLGAFTPAYDNPDDHFSVKTDAAVAVADPTGDMGDTGDTGEPSDTGDTGEPSGTDGPAADRPDGGSAPANVMPSEGPLAGLVGNYLVRMDNYSSASATKDGTTLKVRNRVSNLFVVKLTAQDDGTLLGREFLCDQTYWNSCETGCTNSNAWQTSLDDRVPKFFASRVIDRRYTLDTVDNKTGTLHADPSAIALGFDAGEGGKVDSKAALPADKSDSHVWHLDSSDSTDPVGVRTRIKVDSLKAGLLTQPLDCMLSSVQIYETTFSGQLDLSTKSPLDGKSFSLETKGSAAQSIDVKPTPGGSGGTYCTKSNLDGTTPADAVSWVRFKRYTGVNCPADFESKFPDSTVSSK